MKDKGHRFKIDEFKHAHTHRYTLLLRWQMVEKQNCFYASDSGLAAEWLCKLCWWFVKPLCVLSSRSVCSWRHCSSGANVGRPTHFSENNHWRRIAARRSLPPPTAGEDVLQQDTAMHKKQ